MKSGGTRIRALPAVAVVYLVDDTAGEMGDRPMEIGELESTYREEMARSCLITACEWKMACYGRAMNKVQKRGPTLWSRWSRALLGRSR